jgi:heptaprenyl diphosphate synthase
MAFHYEVTWEEDSIRELLNCYIPIFIEQPPTDEPTRVYKKLLVVFPNIPENRTTVLDRVHAQVKTEFVQSGLMIGQFHKHCPEPSARNPFFLVSVAPIPVVAIRHMAVHDILFLGENETWFREYRARFGCRYERKSVSSELFVKAFNEASDRFPQIAAVGG